MEFHQLRPSQAREYSLQAHAVRARLDPVLQAEKESLPCLAGSHREPRRVVPTPMGDGPHYPSCFSDHASPPPFSVPPLVK